MPQAPVSDAPRCDTPGCGSSASICTDGSEKDAHTTLVPNPDTSSPFPLVKRLDRPAVAGINVCDHHINWPHSDDAKAWAAEPANVAKLAARRPSTPAASPVKAK